MQYRKYALSGSLLPKAFASLEDLGKEFVCERTDTDEPPATKVLDSAALRGYPQWRVGDVNMCQKE
jgi:hypothetical protein